MRPLKIAGYGTAFPAKKVYSAALEAQLGIPEGWSALYSGVKKRYHVEEETNANLGAAAARKALKKANLKLNDISLIISASATYDQPLPHQSSLIKSELDPEDKTLCTTLDINTSCLSFVTAVDIASRYLDSVECPHILVVTAEIASKGLNPSHPKTATLFGDAAAAFVFSYDKTAQYGVLKYQQKTYSKGVDGAYIKGGGNRFFFKDHPYDADLHSFHMDSKPLLRMAMLHIAPFMQDFFQSLPMEIEDLDLIIPHQASKMGLKVFEKQYDFKPNQVFHNLETQGNCIAASIPTALCQALETGRLKTGETCMIAGTSAGFGIGALVLKIGLK